MEGSYALFDRYNTWKVISIFNLREKKEKYKVLFADVHGISLLSELLRIAHVKLSFIC